jgi:hypothetical protein
MAFYLISWYPFDNITRNYKELENFEFVELEKKSKNKGQPNT